MTGTEPRMRYGVPSRRTRLDDRGRAFLVVGSLIIAGCASELAAQEAAPLRDPQVPDVAVRERVQQADVLTPEVLGIDRQAIDRKLTQSFVRQEGFRVLSPQTLPDDDVKKRQIDCEVSCHAYKLRQPVVTFSWSEGVPRNRLRSYGSRRVPIEVNASDLRLDLSQSVGGFRTGTFSTIALRTVPEVPTRQGMGADMRELSVDRLPIYPLPVQQELIRAPQLIPGLMRERPVEDLQQPERLQLQRQELSIERDAEIAPVLEPGFRQSVVIAQTLDRRADIPARKLMVEGLEPGISYRMRLVEELVAGPVEIGASICRIPVCPADFVDR